MTTFVLKSNIANCVVLRHSCVLNLGVYWFFCIHFINKMIKAVCFCIGFGYLRIIGVCNPCIHILSNRWLVTEINYYVCFYQQVCYIKATLVICATTPPTPLVTQRLLPSKCTSRTTDKDHVKSKNIYLHVAILMCWCNYLYIDVWVAVRLAIC